MPMSNPPHPGEIVKFECLEPLDLTVTRAAEGLGVTHQTLSDLINEKTGVTVDMALRLSQAFGSVTGNLARNADGLRSLACARTSRANQGRELRRIKAMTRPIIAIAAILGLISVIAGAAGTHALRDTLDAGALRTFETAARFQMYHALALLATGLLSMRWQTRAPHHRRRALHTWHSALQRQPLHPRAHRHRHLRRNRTHRRHLPHGQAGHPSPSPPSVPNNPLQSCVELVEALSTDISSLPDMICPLRRRMTTSGR